MRSTTKRFEDDEDEDRKTQSTAEEPHEERPAGGAGTLEFVVFGLHVFNPFCQAQPRADGSGDLQTPCRSERARGRGGSLSPFTAPLRRMASPAGRDVAAVTEEPAIAAPLLFVLPGRTREGLNRARL